jgi:sensor histidine kinase YesM
MQVRFQGRLSVDTDVSSDVMDALVPNFVLQPLVENAVMHGVSKVQGEGRIQLRARRVGDEVVIMVQDNGPGLDAQDSGTPVIREGGGTGGVGLTNTRARLEQLYGKDQQLKLHRAPEGGTVSEIVLPYHTTADDVVPATA